MSVIDVAMRSEPEVSLARASAALSLNAFPLHKQSYSVGDRCLAGGQLPSMRLHKAGEKCFVDYAGQTVAITDPQTGKQSKAHIFVGLSSRSFQLHL